MRSRHQSGGVSVLIDALLLTGVSAAQAAPNTFNTALPVAKGQYLWREQLVLRERSDNGPMDRDVSVQALGSVLGYGVTSKFAVFGVTAPTGEDHDRDRFGELPRPLQTGDGAWDGFARGDETRFDASLQYRIWPRSMKGVPGTPSLIYALLESNVIHRERDETSSGTDADSGGTQWLLAPGLQYVSRRWIVEGTVQLSVAEDFNGDAIEDDSIVRVGFRRSF